MPDGAAVKDTIRSAMPLLVRNEGIWEGWYRYYSAETGALVDQHKSRLLCRFLDGDPEIYHQTNYYFWEDGKREVREFPAEYRNGRIWWDNDLIKGWAAQMQPDDFNRSTCLNWVRKGEPDLYLYEMIQLSDCGQMRCRTWHWIKGGKCFQRTLIDEHKVTSDWKSFIDFDTPPAL